MRILPSFLALALLAGCKSGREIMEPQRAARCLAAVREAHAAGQWSRACRCAKPLMKAHPRTQGAEEALLLAADAEEKRGRPTAAYRDYEALVREHPASDRIREVSRREFDLASARHAEGRRRLKGHFMQLGPAVREVLESSARHDPYASHAAYALLLAATCEYDDRRYEEAGAILDRLLQDNPRSDWVIQAQFLRAMASYRSFHGAPYDPVPLKDAEERFRSYLADHPDAEDAPAARRMLVLIGDHWAEHGVITGRLYRRLGKEEAAALSFRESMEGFPDSPWAEVARGEAGAR